MSDRAHLLVAVVTALTVFFILRLVRHRQMRAKYAMLWLAAGAVLVVLAIAPGLLVPISDMVGIAYAPATFLLVALAFLFLVVVHFSWEMSRLEDRTRKLAEEIALLRTEVRLGAGGANDGSGPGPAGDHDEPVGQERRPQPARQPLGGEQG